MYEFLFWYWIVSTLCVAVALIYDWNSVAEQTIEINGIEYHHPLITAAIAVTALVLSMIVFSYMIFSGFFDNEP